MLFPDWLREREATDDGVLTRLMRESGVSYYPLWRASQGHRVSFESATKIRETITRLYGDCPIALEELCAPPDDDARRAAQRRADARRAHQTPALPKAG